MSDRYRNAPPEPNDADAGAFLHRLVVEFTIEPFVEGEPGPHVRAAVEAAEQSGVTVDFGPFGTTVAGDDDAVLTAVDRLLRAATAAGATRVSLQVVRET